MNPFECTQTTDLCPIAGIDVDTSASSIGFTVTADTPYDCWNQISLADLNACEVMSNTNTPSWIRCMLQAALTPRVL